MSTELMCANLMCPKHLVCLRFIDKPSSRQTYFDFRIPQGKRKCGAFINTVKRIVEPLPNIIVKGGIYKLLKDVPSPFALGVAGSYAYCYSYSSEERSDFLLQSHNGMVHSQMGNSRLLENARRVRKSWKTLPEALKEMILAYQDQYGLHL